MTANCLTCNKWLTCSDFKKSHKYICSKYREVSSSDLKRIKTEVIYEDVESTTGYFYSQSDDYFNKKEIDLERIMDEVFSDTNPVPKDLKIDDRDMPVMPNFYAFCFDKKWGYTGIKPFSRQLWIYSMLFGEICPVS